ncbi:hypothetical protein GYMLUDRAFT_64302 [Collybiopsis luxurians FD-317 M1]|uniref:Uncharacterized protein n=1 Tax=Collybiopsis luxurians FD-317 M1 TaxID=944289 RepID=A0A0D0APY1_9AGAR|nr:hypothetical protein GYMLUDRAFT_64302 [Collybiopsis luxurians FD-317 M1]
MIQGATKVGKVLILIYLLSSQDGFLWHFLVLLTKGSCLRWTILLQLNLAHLKVDHTFDYLKYMGGLNGQQIHEASYTNVNQFEEICSLALVPSKSLLYVAETLQGVAKGLQEHGHPPCSIIYTGSPQSEQQFHDKITPSLQKNVEPVTSSRGQTPFERSKNMEVIFVEDVAFMDQLCGDI